MSELFPVFLKLEGRPVLLVGGGKVARAKLPGLLAAGAKVTVVAPEIQPELAQPGVTLVKRGFEPSDLDGAWLVVSAAPAEVNREVARAAETRRVFVNAVDDPRSGSAYTGGVLRRGGVTVALSTEGRAPALAGLLREGFDALLPKDVDRWVAEAEAIRAGWRARGVPMPNRRPLLLQALNQIYARPGEGERWGFVSLVGAGPGDPELLTLKAARRLEQADLVLYDALVSPEVLALAPKAQKFFVGKRARRKSMKQQTIERLMVRAARRGKRVVRLKCGDPVVLGRGGEEALALASSGIPFEVVPGISSAIAAPELAGIPVTHRGLSSAFLVVSGHAESAYGPVLASVAPNSITVVVLMGLATRSELANTLLAGGWRPETPTALILAASTPRQTTWTGRLDEVGSAEVGSSEDPGVLVIGEVVHVAGALRAAPLAEVG